MNWRIGFRGFVDERVNKIVNWIRARLVGTDLSTLREVQDAYHSLMSARAGVKGKRVKRELVRDLLFLVQAVKNVHPPGVGVKLGGGGHWVWFVGYAEVGELPMAWLSCTVCWL